MSKRRQSGEGALFKRETGRHKGKWVARTIVGYDSTGQPIRKDMMFKTQGEGLAKLKEINLKLAKGIDVVPNKVLLGEYLTSWLDRVKANLTPNTFGRYRCACLIHMKEDSIWRMRLGDIRARHVNDLIARRAKAEAKPPTLHNIRRVLHTAMRQAVTDDLISENPVSKSDLVKQQDKNLRFMNNEDTKRFFEGAKGSFVEDLVIMAVYSGMRLSELLGLTWDRIDFENGRVLVDRQLQRVDGKFILAPLKTKGGKGTILVSATALERLKARKGAQMLAEYKTPQQLKGLVFCGATGQPMYRTNVTNETNRAMVKAGLDKLGCHALRHTCASILINAGADPLKVQRQLRHASVRITLEIYSHLFEERLQENVTMMEKALGA